MQTYAALDYETQSSYFVTIGVSDGRGGSDSITVTINVIDVLESTPLSARTPEVSAAIIAAVPGANSASDVNDIDLAAITSLDLSNYSPKITALKADDFDGLSSLEELYLDNNDLSNLPEDIFNGLSSLEILHLHQNGLSSLPVGMFSGLSALRELSMFYNGLSSLPMGVFSGLSALRLLDLSHNGLSSLPMGVFSGLSALRELYLHGNTVNPLPLSVSLEKVEEGMLKAVVPVGAPFDIVLPLTVMNGSARTLTIPKGRVESGSLTVIRLAGTIDAVTVDIGTLPQLPLRHAGYNLVKSEDQPLTVIDPVDVEPPSVTIGVPSGTQTGAFDATITFSETVLGFASSDVSLTGSAASITAWRANGDNTIYTATITPMASGTVTISVSADVATDAAGNPNTEATSQPVTVDVDPPEVSISVPSGVQNGAFDVTITFTETVSGFVQSDVSLTGSAASITAWRANGDNTIYTATITPMASGTVTISVSADVATDAVGNPNIEATPQTVTVDVDPPEVSISVPSGVQNGVFDVTITFTESVSGFTQSDLSLSGMANATITSWNPSGNTTYTATITPTSSGSVTLNVPSGVATDVANNPNTAATSQTVSVDVDRPRVTIGVPSGTQTGAFDATITFTEPVSDFVQSDVSLTGSAASITAWSTNTNNTVYTATITPTDSGTVTIGVAANVATDAVGNPNTEATPQTVTIEIPIPDPATWMPDANLRTAVRSALGIGSNANFSTNDLSFLTRLHAVQASITNLSGLEYATNLTSLVAWQNQVSSLTPLQNLTQLTEIRMGSNEISDVSPLSGLTALTSLGLQRNNIVDVSPLASLVNLTWLRLRGNNLITDFSALVTLGECDRFRC